VSRNVSRFKLGLFVLICTAIAIGSLVWIGVGQLFQPGNTYVTFFDSSVEGLSRGAEVSYLGIKVGRVVSYGIAPDRKLIRVVLELSPDFKVDGSLAISLAQRGITGQRYLELGKAPAHIDQITPKVTFPVQYPVIPSRPGEVATVEQALKQLYQKIEEVDFEALAGAWTQAARDADAVLADQDIQETLKNARKISEDLKRSMGFLGEKGGQEELKKSLSDLTRTLEATQKASEALARELGAIPQGSLAKLTKDMDRTVEASQEALFHLRQLITELKELAETLRQQPGKILTEPQEPEPFGRQ
jgi:ABC-type transporter Mla subunit MlaD